MYVTQLIFSGLRGFIPLHSPDVQVLYIHNTLKHLTRSFLLFFPDLYIA